MREVHRRFKAFFESHEPKLTQQGVAKSLGISQVAVSRLLRGEFKTVSNKVAQNIERLTADWEHGPIRASEWIAETDQPPNSDDEDEEPARAVGVAS